MSPAVETGHRQPWADTTWGQDSRLNSYPEPCAAEPDRVQTAWATATTSCSLQAPPRPLPTGTPPDPSRGEGAQQVCFVSRCRGRKGPRQRRTVNSNSQCTVPAGCLDCLPRAVDGFRHLAVRECDQSELRLQGGVLAVITERLGQGQRGRAKSTGYLSFWGSAARRTQARSPRSRPLPLRGLYRFGVQRVAGGADGAAMSGSPVALIGSRRRWSSSGGGMGSLTVWLVFINERRIGGGLRRERRRRPAS